MKLNVEIKNCYGIDNLVNEFDFTKDKSTQVIYAPNGVMKTSFANVFDDYSKGIESKDLIYPNRASVRIINENIGEEINPDSIFVIRPYEQSFKTSKISTLLVNEQLREEYDKIHEKINVETANLIQGLKVTSGISRNIEESICETFSGESLLIVLSKFEEEVKNESLPLYSHLKYNSIFNEKVVNFLETGDIKRQIKDYIEKYDELIRNSPIFSERFNHYNAATVHKNLNDNGFFSADHTINLSLNGKKQEISTQAEFLRLIKGAKEDILKDVTLQTIFNNIDKKITNVQLREFRDYLFQNQEILIELEDLNKFKQKLWTSYLKENKDAYISLITEFKIGQDKIKKIIEKAKKQKTDWENVIDIFNRRFYVPYRLGIKNKEDSILKDDTPTVEYYFKNRIENVDEDLLLRVLSQGEKRTLYLLNIIFEIESRKKQGMKTIFIIDDIADSFDYKNKYAIIEYLKDVTEFNNFFSIILTHNFDFFRTVQERICGDSKYMGSYMAIKEEGLIKLEKLKYRYISNPLKNWKSNLSDRAKLIASSTFARNIAEYIGDDDSFNKLTSLLHMKVLTTKLKIKDLLDIYKIIFKDLNELELSNSDEYIYDIIFEVAEQIIESNFDSVANLENKVVLSIAIRLNAEMYMIKRINNTEFISKINKNQTGILFGKYKELYPEDINSIKVLERVNIMTPENIHLNSFMFEPILDISDHHLKQLYNEVKLLIVSEELNESKLQVAATKVNED